jgi:hypothetical protein
MSFRIQIVRLIAILTVPTLSLVPALAGGPMYVTGPAATQPGQPYRWALNPIPYQTDWGGLGNQTNAQANEIVSTGFQTWQNAATANIKFQYTGQLSNDITSDNILTFQDGIADCGDSLQPVNGIIYDVDGSAIEALGMDKNSVIGFSAAVCADDQIGVYTRGWSVLNGRYIDGLPDSSSHSSLTLEAFKTAVTHQFGHLIGLDHSQINLNCLTDQSCPAEDMSGLPLMFPTLLDGMKAALGPDDIASLSVLYPGSSFSATTGRVQGRVFFSDGRTPAQGYNVVARLVGNPRRIAISSVSGFLFTASAGNPLAPIGSDTESFFGSRDQSLIGYYDLPGLQPGDYTIEVEALYNSGNTPFVEGASVGPIGAYLGYQYKLPGACSPQYLNYPSSPTDTCTAKITMSVAAGSVLKTNTDVIFLGTPPRFDAWEDEP